MRVPLLCLLLVAAAGCDALSDTLDEAACSASGYADEGEMSATVDGGRYSTACVRVETEANLLTVGSIDNVVSDNDQRLLAVTAPAEVGSYEIGSSAALGAYTFRAADASQQAEQTYAATSGTITIATVSANAASGTFSFVGRTPAGDQVTVASGAFDVTF